MVRSIFTLGHSNRTGAELAGLLAAAEVAELVDVRTHPGSRHNPQFNQDTLRAALLAFGIRYHWAGRDLGGLRGSPPGSVHVALPVALHGYAEHMGSHDFKRAAARLCQLADARNAAVMCAERDPAACHRSLLADYLTWRGREVIHLLEPGRSIVHRLHARARITDAGLIYDRATQGSFTFACDARARRG